MLCKCDGFQYCFDSFFAFCINCGFRFACFFAWDRNESKTKQHNEKQDEIKKRNEDENILLILLNNVFPSRVFVTVSFV